MIFNFCTLALMAVAAVSVSASPAPLTSALVARDEAAVDTTLLPDFQYRFYKTGNCDHSSPAEATFPPINETPSQGYKTMCWSAPVGTNWNRLEIDRNVVVHTYCNINCQGGRTDDQSGSHCFVPVSGCAIGSFQVSALE